MKSQTIWRECTNEEKLDRASKGVLARKRKSGWKPTTYETTIMLTGENKSRPGRRIIDSGRPKEFVYVTDR